ncbi:MAG: CheR family methyltransferase [Myxococcota bacterium]
MSRPPHGLEDVLTWLADERGLDVRDYRRETIARAVAQRAGARGVEVPSYPAVVAGDPGELAALISAIAVPVTSFFRDADTFDALATRVIPALGRRVRAWAAGTSTGEEAWSLAMLLEAAREAGTLDAWDLVATDRDAAAIAVAQAGRYAAAALDAAPEDLRARFVTREGPFARVRGGALPGLRFAAHDLVGPTLAPPEAVVASFHLVLVRNVMIYFDGRLREKALARLAGVIEPGGALVVGVTEALSSVGPSFSPWPSVATACGVFRRRGGG